MIISEWGEYFSDPGATEAVFWGESENEGFTQLCSLAQTSLGVFLVVGGFDELANRNRMRGSGRVCSLDIPRHVGSGGVRPEITRAIDLPAFAGQRWGSPTRTSLRE
ncbi:MAG: hypothetical protein CMM07_00125 [Rhodopirellula sp.]|nr:hypothetical protein [Rhodopirellula sp.]